MSKYEKGAGLLTSQPIIGILTRGRLTGQPNHQHDFALGERLRNVLHQPSLSRGVQHHLRTARTTAGDAKHTQHAQQPVKHAQRAIRGRGHPYKGVLMEGYIWYRARVRRLPGATSIPR